MADEFYTPLQEYEKARKIAQRQYRASVSAGQYPYLPSLDDMLPYEDIVSESYLGLVEIPLDQIAGTKTAGRQNAFSNGFCRFFLQNQSLEVSGSICISLSWMRESAIRLKPTSL